MQFQRTIVEPLQAVDSRDQENLFSKIITSLHENGFKESAARIDELRKMEDLDDGEKPLFAESALGFPEFIARFSCLGEPVLGLFPEGTLSAGWRVADNKHLLIEFLDRNNISFAMIGPDGTDGKFRLNGRGSQEAGLQALERNGVAQWRE